MLWILDNGHGGLINGVYQTDGKRSPVWPDGSQLFEGEFNRDVVARIARNLNILGIDNHVLVPEQEDITLTERVKRVNDIYETRKDVVLISVHANASGGTGWEIYTSIGETRSDKIAPFFMEAMQKVFPKMKYRKDTTDGDVDKEAKFKIITKTLCPAVLTENFFMDTLKPDCKILMSNQGRELIAMAHVRAIQKIEKLKPNNFYIED